VGKETLTGVLYRLRIIDGLRRRKARKLRPFLVAAMVGETAPDLRIGPPGAFEALTDDELLALSESSRNRCGIWKRGSERRSYGGVHPHSAAQRAQK
jgi:hypothetical protein